MSINIETEIRYNKIAGTILQNVIAEKELAGKIVLWDFQENQPTDRLYFNIATMYSDLTNDKVYIHMPLIPYLKLKWKRRKVRKNLRWVTPWLKNELPDEAKTSVYIIMDFVRAHYDLPYETFKEINDEFYGWVE